MYQERTYRRIAQAKDLVGFRVGVKETDLWIQAQCDLSPPCRKIVGRIRDELENYLSHHPEFATSLLPVSPALFAPPIVQRMAGAADLAHVGPMAAVAGAIAELVGEELSPLSPEIIVENGGDIYLRSRVDRVVQVYAGNSPFSHRLGLKVHPEGRSLGICTSAGTIGHSLSLGMADAALILAASAALADAAATRLGNRVQRKEDIPAALELVRSIPGVRGALVIVGEDLGTWGDWEMIDLAESKPGPSPFDPIG